MQTNHDQDNDIDQDLNADVSQIALVFIKPVVKKFVDEVKTVYVIVSEKGKALAVFGSIKACRHFCIRNRLHYCFAH